MGHREGPATKGRPPTFAGLTLDRPHIMGIVNVTPDSFSGGARLTSVDAAIDHALRLEDEGASILDIGGESTRPGADPVSLAEERARVLPVLAALSERASARISVDTRKSDLMEEAAEAGAHIINDVSALTHDPQAVSVVAKTGLPVILMHALGDPKTMQIDPHYDDVLGDVIAYLAERIKACKAAGIAHTNLAVDPGIGFGKNQEHNLIVLAGLGRFAELEAPVVIGGSRKSFIGKIGNAPDPESRVPGSIAVALAALSQGVHILRVHDVQATRQAVDVWQAIGRSR